MLKYCIGVLYLSTYGNAVRTYQSIASDYCIQEVDFIPRASAINDATEVHFLQLNFLSVSFAPGDKNSLLKLLYNRQILFIMCFGLGITFEIFELLLYFTIP